MDQSFVKSPVLGPEGVVIAQVPFAEDTRMVTGVGENIGHSHFIPTQQGAAHDGMPDAGPVAVAARHQPCPRGRAGRGNVKVRQPNALGVKPVQVGRF